VQTSIMDEGQIGDIYYGLSHGTADNFTRAQRDSKLINNAVNLRLRNGETMDAAIAGVSKDLYGDVQVVNQPHAQIIIPTNQDPSAVLTGLSSKLPEVETALKQALAMPAGVNAADGTKAVIAAATANHIPNVLANGFFRNSGDGYRVHRSLHRTCAVADQNGAADRLQDSPAISQRLQPEWVDHRPRSFRCAAAQPDAQERWVNERRLFDERADPISGHDKACICWTAAMSPAALSLSSTLV
jgi:hypothetical protein